MNEIETLRNNGDIKKIISKLKNGKKEKRKEIAILLNQNISKKPFDIPESFKIDICDMVINEKYHSIRSELIEVIKMLDDDYLSLLNKRISEKQNSNDYPKHFEDWLESDYTEVKLVAFNYLSENYKNYIHKEIKELCVSSNLRLRKEAIKTAGDLGYNKFVENLSENLNHKNPEVREYAIDSLIKINSDEAFNLLLPICIDKEHEYYMKVLRNIGDFGNLDCFGSIIYGYNDSDKKIKFESVKSSVKLILNTNSHKAKKTIASYYGDDSTEYLKRLLDLDNYEMRRNAIWLIGEVSNEYNEELIEKLVKCIDCEDKITEQIAKSVLRDIDDRKVVRKLDEYIRDNNVKSRSLEHADYIKNKIIIDKSYSDIRKRNVEYTNIDNPKEYTENN